MTYLNNAATTVAKPEGYRDAPKATAALAAEKVARLLGCKNPENIVFTGSGDEAVRAAVLSFVKPGDHVISTDMEYKSVLNVLSELEEKGCTVTYIP